MTSYARAAADGRGMVSSVCSTAESMSRCVIVRGAGCIAVWRKTSNSAKSPPAATSNKTRTVALGSLDWQYFILIS